MLSPVPRSARGKDRRASRHRHESRRRIYLQIESARIGRPGQGESDVTFESEVLQAVEDIISEIEFGLLDGALQHTAGHGENPAGAGIIHVVEIPFSGRPAHVVGLLKEPYPGLQGCDEANAHYSGHTTQQYLSAKTVVNQVSVDYMIGQSGEYSRLVKPCGQRMLLPHPWRGFPTVYQILFINTQTCSRFLGHFPTVLQQGISPSPGHRFSSLD